MNPTQKIEIKINEKDDGSVEIIGGSVPYEAEIDSNKQTGQLLLKKFEDNAKLTMDNLLKKLKNNMDDEEIKLKYFEARAIYNEIAA